MKVTFLLLVCLLALGISANSQTAPAANASAPAAEAKPKKKIFRANKGQIEQAQTILKTKSLYTGEKTGKLDPATRISIKGFQKESGLRETGTLNRATLEKMGIELTDGQKAIPSSPNSYAPAQSEMAALKSGTEAKPKRVIFRASRDQIAEAQKTLRSGSMYGGEETGKLDDATRDGLRKYQAANGLKVTGTLNQATLEKMGISLTEKQKADAAGSQK